jgi:hypothetical protein
VPAGTPRRARAEARPSRQASAPLGADQQPWLHGQPEEVLADLGQWRWAPTFVFADQQAAEVHWETLRKIAAFRNGKTKRGGGHRDGGDQLDAAAVGCRW